MTDLQPAALAMCTAEELSTALMNEAAATGLKAALPTLSDPATAHLVAELTRLVGAKLGYVPARVRAGELLGLLGDPRLRLPSDDEYWASIELKSGDRVFMGRYPVTNHEFTAFVNAGAYDQPQWWSEQGKAWLAGCSDPWPTLAERDNVDAYLVPNQPAVGLTFFEAEAYANFRGARLPAWYERVRAVRGAEKRPYPWGSPFGEGNTNSKEEVVGRPCAVGLFLQDCTPDGICDLAGNVGEWVGDESGDEQLYHPGAFDQPSMACWAKALTSQRRDARWGGLGFRLAKDA